MEKNQIKEPVGIREVSNRMGLFCSMLLSDNDGVKSLKMSVHDKIHKMEVTTTAKTGLKERIKIPP